MFGYIGKSIYAKFLYPASKELYRFPDYYGWKFEEVVLDVSGFQTYGWFIPPEREAIGYILFSHGNAGNIADRLESVNIFRKMDLGVLVYDYGGYGKSTGRPSEKRCCEDAYSMWKWLTGEKKVQPNKIVLFGRSLGGAVTADLATRVECAGVILESTFLSTIDVANDIFGWVPRFFARGNEFNTKNKVGKIKSPVLVVHSPEDTLIKFYHGKEIYELVVSEKYFLEIRGDHNEGFIITGDKYVEEIRKFIYKVLGVG
ncbi:MAG: alpha/beta hydrolase [Candidatus Hydrogenedentes bacterium]|nr:alpha/beta hydrolase [Candidatus Hydrogenedentota bacterium]